MNAKKIKPQNRIKKNGKCLPKICPFLNIEEAAEALTCKQDNEPISNPALCQLDLETNIDYRTCEKFSAWFWDKAKKERTKSNKKVA